MYHAYGLYILRLSYNWQCSGPFLGLLIIKWSSSGIRRVPSSCDRYWRIRTSGQYRVRILLYRWAKHLFYYIRISGLEPLISVWKTEVLPLYYTRSIYTIKTPFVTLFIALKNYFYILIGERRTRTSNGIYPYDLQSHALPFCHLTFKFI